MDQRIICSNTRALRKHRFLSRSGCRIHRYLISMQTSSASPKEFHLELFVPFKAAGGALPTRASRRSAVLFSPILTLPLAARCVEHLGHRWTDKFLNLVPNVLSRQGSDSRAPIPHVCCVPDLLHLG